MRLAIDRAKEWLLERSLWQVTVVYLLSTWAALGHIDLLADRFGIADWVFDASLVAALVGLMAVLLVSSAMKRHVPLSRFVRVGLAYVVGGWVLIEVVAFLGERGLFGELVLRGAILLIAGLLPVALLIALFWPANTVPDADEKHAA